MVYILGCIEYGYDLDKEYCFDILDYVRYTPDNPNEITKIIHRYEEKYNKIPTIVLCIQDDSVFFNINVLIQMFEPVRNQPYYRICLGYYDSKFTIQYVNCRIGNIEISSDFPGCPLCMAGVPRKVFIQLLDHYPEVRRCIPNILVEYIQNDSVESFDKS